MRTLFSLLVVVAIIAGFSLFTILLPRWRTGYEKLPLVRGDVVALPEQRSDGPVTFVAAVYSGRAGRLPGPEATPIDDASPDPTLGGGRGVSPASFRFELDAGSDDGPRFVVRGVVETTSFERFCATAVLPPVVVVDGEWVERATRRPLAPVRLAPRDPC